MARITHLVILLILSSFLIADCARHTHKHHKHSSVGKKATTTSTAKKSSITVVSSSKKTSANSGITLVGGNKYKPASPSSSSSGGTDLKATAQAALQYLSKVPGLSGYADLLNTVFTFYDALQEVTVLLPMRPDTLYGTYKKNYTKEQQQQVASYHILALRCNFADLRQLPNGEELFTLEGSSVIKQAPAGSYLTLLSDNSTAFPAVVVAPNLYNNSNFIVHGISRMLMPSDFSQ